MGTRSRQETQVSCACRCRAGVLRPVRSILGFTIHWWSQNQCGTVSPPCPHGPSAGMTNFGSKMPEQEGVCTEQIQPLFYLCSLNNYFHGISTVLENTNLLERT